MYYAITAFIIALCFSLLAQATDLDSEDSTLLYVLTFSPQHGSLNKTLEDGSQETLKIGSNFTQNDLDEERITYTHYGTLYHISVKACVILCIISTLPYLWRN